MATAPRPGVGNRKEAEQTTLTIKLDGATHVCRPSEITAKMAGQLRRESGLSVVGVMEAAGSDPDLDVIASIVWLARHQAGETVSWDEVASAITYDSDIDSSDEAPEDDQSPEA